MAGGSCRQAGGTRLPPSRGLRRKAGGSFAIPARRISCERVTRILGMLRYDAKCSGKLIPNGARAASRELDVNFRNPGRLHQGLLNHPVSDRWNAEISRSGAGSPPRRSSMPFARCRAWPAWRAAERQWRRCRQGSSASGPTIDGNGPPGRGRQGPQRGARHLPGSLIESCSWPPSCGGPDCPLRASLVAAAILQGLNHASAGQSTR
jgi:hypothetical protein